MRIKLFLLFSVGIAVVCCAPDKKQMNSINLDLTPSKVELFGEGIVTTELYERDIAILPNGNEVIFTLGDYKQKKRDIVQIKKTGNKWSEPEILNISGKYHDIEPFYAERGNRLFFASNRPINNNFESKNYNIWYSDRVGDTWSEPIALNDKINTENDEFYPSLSNNGNLYFTASRKDGVGLEDIYVSKKINGEYTNPVVMDSAINTKHFEFNAYINPDENLLIFSSFGRPDDFGGGDLYYSLKDEKGTWAEAKNMGEIINSPKLDYCPFIDVSRGNLYFTSERVIALPDKLKNIDALKAFSASTENGMGNIYRIDIKKLNLK